MKVTKCKIFNKKKILIYQTNWSIYSSYVRIYASLSDCPTDVVNATEPYHSIGNYNKMKNFDSNILKLRNEIKIKLKKICTVLVLLYFQIYDHGNPRKEATSILYTLIA